MTTTIPDMASQDCQIQRAWTLIWQSTPTNSNYFSHTQYFTKT